MGRFRIKFKFLVWVIRWIAVLFMDMGKIERGDLLGRKILNIYN